MHVHTYMQVPKTTRTGSQIPWDWSYSQLWAAWSEYWESNSGPWKPASVLIAEWCLQPSRHFLRPSLVPLVGWEGALLPVKSRCLEEVCGHCHHFPTRWIAENHSFAETIPSTRPPDCKLLNLELSITTPPIASLVWKLKLHICISELWKGLRERNVFGGLLGLF